jgi:hypothetical protein
MAFKLSPSIDDTSKVGKNTYKWNGKGWVVEAGGIVGSVSTSKRTEFTATAGQTIFTVNYTPSYIDVYMNGVHLDSSDYTASNGTTIVLNIAAVATDELYVVAFGKFVVDDHYAKGEVDTIINNSINGIIDTAPANLNTLKELSAALNDDSNFASTVTTSLTTKADASTTYTKAEVDVLLSDLEALVYGLTGGS